MFTAISLSGRTVSLLAGKDKAYIASQSQWFCPVCNERLRLKKGRKRRSHFAHVAYTNCPSTTAESEHHLEGKAFLYEWLNKQGAGVSVEAQIFETNQRADLLVHGKEQTLAIEYQCSAIDREKIRARTVSYQSVGIQTIWVLPFYRLRRKGNTIRLQDWEWEVTDHSRYVPRIYFLQAPSTLWIAHLGAYLSPQKAYAQVLSYPLLTSSFEDVKETNPSITNSSKAMLTYKKNCRYGKRLPPTPFSIQVQELLLRHKLPLHLHPAEAGWFLPCQAWVREPPLLWQSWLFIQLLYLLKRQTYISPKMLDQHLQYLSRHLQLSMERTQVLMDQYLTLLVNFDVLYKRNGGFVLAQRIRFPQSADEGYEMDQRYAYKGSSMVTN
ncbi:competence CoiA-like predicted nuclease [Geomicrobium halophilum]|uniref:Competence CoiA-like predicted nuclease n=1 Tax=Geomicrobium halophilum TaxID=549000 RepID=A0A841PZZ1_9BACL|nr:competence protein CoiA family protein [Geomicrobium halophilum]MBB6448478.1 competence CoiA-like predicted nuclease [Geomicrobium halophilum]